MVFIIDASSFIFRAFFAIPRLSTSKGLPTNATYGFVQMLLSVVEKHKPEFVVCVFDTKKATFRSEMYSEYKSNRGAPPDDLVPQFEYIYRAVEALGIKRLAEPGFEADDLIATLTHKFKEHPITIVTGDKDLMQLVDHRVRLLDTMKDISYGPAEVKAKLGVDPQNVTDYLALIGDSSDNIPGIPGVGPKTAVELIQTFGDLEKILEAAPSMKPGKRRDLLIEHAEIARLSKKLATVHSEVQGCCENIHLNDLKAPQEIQNEFRKFIAELEFHTLVKKYPAQIEAQSCDQAEPQIAVGRELEIKLVCNEKEWKSCIEKLSTYKTIAFDTETRGRRTTETEMVGFSLCGDGKEAFYIPVRHNGDGTQDQVHAHQAAKDLGELFQGKLVIAQNLKYDYKVFLKEGLNLSKVRGIRFYDTMLAHYLVDPEEKHGLDMLTKRYLNSEVGDFHKVLGDRPDFSYVPLEDASRYGGLDAWACWNLYDPLTQELRRLDLEKLFYEIEMPVVPVLAHMEWNGVALDARVLEELSAEYSRELEQIEKEIFETVGSPFNLNSPKQLSEVLFSKLGLPVIQKTKTGLSTDAFVLEKLAGLHPVPALIVRYRELTKLKSTYVDVLPTLLESDGRVHANFNQAVTATGRLSSSDPNLQNIPIKTESGRRIRKAFVAEKGNVLVGADYSQIELRLVAQLSGDETLIEAFKNNKDIHRATASEIFRVPEDQVTDTQRAAAKAINFGLIYGKTAFSLSQELKISRSEAQSYIDAYFTRYKGVKTFMEKCMSDARRERMACTMFGRKRPIKDIDSKNFAVRGNAERMALNTPVQGTAADIMKLAMARVHEECSRSGAKIVLQVHDELVLEVPEEKASETLEALKKNMEGVVQLLVPLEVNSAVHRNWMDL